jgi:hypothetical protein
MDRALENLRKLRAKAAEINGTLIHDLLPFFLPNRMLFQRLPSGSDDKGNVTNTCSCLMALVTADVAVEFFRQSLAISSDDEAQDKITEIFEKAVRSEWTSSGLADNNAFTSLIVLRTGAVLSSLLRRPVLNMSHPAYELRRGKVIKTRGSRTLKQVISDFGVDPPNTFQVDKYPATPGIAYWFVDAVETLMPSLDEKVWKKLAEWNAGTFSRQLSLVAAKHDAMKDPVAMALAACLARRLHRIITNGSFAERDYMIEILPTKIEVEGAVLNSLAFQEPSGIWPKYFPLFNYKKEGVGSNYLFSFEVLEAIVEEFEHSKVIENKVMIRAFERALDWCESNRLTYKLGDRIYQGWNSGGQITTLMHGKPEAWATAIVHMFLAKLRLALSFLIKDHVLDKYGATDPSVQSKKRMLTWGDVLDSPVEIRGVMTSAKEVLSEHILRPVREQKVFPQGLITQRQRSALLFGPPGTAKTTIVRAIANEIGWPLVELNPSNFLSRGLENIYSQADEIFSDLQDLSQTVVFFDEMDALTQRRVKDVDVTRQFLTTSMLPKLSRLHDTSRVLFFMATNHLRSFDDAITRPGRFDVLLHVRPPLWKHKLDRLENVWPGRNLKEFQTSWSPSQRKKDADFVKGKIKLWVPPDGEVTVILDRFTPGEMESFLGEFGQGPNLKKAFEKMTAEEFIKAVENWGKHYIALHSEKSAEPRDELSLLEEFQLDLTASRT